MRTLTLLSRAVDLEAEHLPAAWREAPLAVLGPVANEVDPALAGAFDDASVAVLPQGWMRKRGRGGLIAPQPWEDAEAVLPWTQLLVVSEEDVGDSEETAVTWLHQVPVGAITRAQRGATLYVNGEPYHVMADMATGGGSDGGGRCVRDHPSHRVSAERRRVGSGGGGSLRRRGVGRRLPGPRPSPTGPASTPGSPPTGSAAAADVAREEARNPQAAEKGPAARRRPSAAREAYSCTLSVRPRELNEADGPLSAAC